MTREQLTIAGIPIPKRNQNRTGGRNIDPAEDSQVGLDPECGGGDVDDADMLGRDVEEEQPRPPTPPNVDINNLADDVSAISLAAPNKTPTNGGTTSAIMSYSTRIHAVPDVPYLGLHRTLYIARLDLPGGIVEVDATMKEDCMGMTFRCSDLPGAFNGEQVGANMAAEIQRAINRDGQEEIDGLELVNNTPHRIVPVSFPEMTEPHFICIEQNNFGARENFIVCRNVPGTTRRIALVGAFSKRNKPIRLMNNYVPTYEEVMHNQTVFFGNYMQPPNAAPFQPHAPFRPVPQQQPQAPPQPLPPPQQPLPPPQPQPPVGNDALLQQMLQRMREQENQFNRQLAENRRNTWIDALNTMANANPAIAIELNRLDDHFLEALTPETFRDLVARLNRLPPVHLPPAPPQPQPQPEPPAQPQSPAFPAAAAAAVGNTVVIDDVSSGSELT